MKHTLPPYNGNDSYIFISYSHRDSETVLKIVARLISEGVRLWYDEGIDPGTEWDENIAAHIEGCDVVLSFLSDNYLHSENCKDELNFARDLNKDRILVYLEDVKLPSGMAMRLNRLQSIHMYTYRNQEEFYGKLIAAPVIRRNRALTAGAAPTEKPAESPATPMPEPTPKAEPPTPAPVTEQTPPMQPRVQPVQPQQIPVMPRREEQPPVMQTPAQNPFQRPEQPPMVPHVRKSPPHPTIAPPPPPMNPFTTGKTATPMETILQKTAEALECYGITDHYYPNGSAEFRKKIDEARGAYAKYSIAETPLMLEDFTLLGSGKQGMVLTDTHLYLSSAFVKKAMIALSKIWDIQVLSDGTNQYHILLRTEDGDYAATTATDSTLVCNCAAFLKEIIPYLNSVSAIRTQPVLRSFSSNIWTCACGTRCKDAFCPNCGRKKN